MKLLTEAMILEMLRRAWLDGHDQAQRAAVMLTLDPTKEALAMAVDTSMERQDAYCLAAIERLKQ